jgi:hypothetical protein
MCREFESSPGGPRNDRSHMDEGIMTLTPGTLEGERRLPQELDKLMGTWSLKLRHLTTGEELLGEDTFELMDGGFFMTLHHEEFDRNIKGTMIIGYDPDWDEAEPGRELLGHWFESSTGNHLVYVWELGETELTLWLGDVRSDSVLRARFSDDLTTVSGTWRWPGGGHQVTMVKKST